MAKLLFQAKFEDFGDRFFKNKISAQANTKKTFTYIMCSDNSHHLLNFFWYLLVLYINSSVTCLKFAPKWPFSYFQPILVAIFVTIATVKVKSIRQLYTLAIVIIN